MTNKEKVERVLRDAGKPLSVADIQKKTRMNYSPSQDLASLCDEKIAERVGRGMYAAVTQPKPNGKPAVRTVAEETPTRAPLFRGQISSSVEFDITENKYLVMRFGLTERSIPIEKLVAFIEVEGDRV